MLFVLLGLAALVIELGFARLTQRQMQTAVDSAAVEGLRFRDDIPLSWQPGGALHAEIAEAIVDSGGDPPPAKPFDRADPGWMVWIEHCRRWGASQMIINTFHDDLNSGNGDAIGFGAGPLIELEGGIGPPELAAAQSIKEETLGVWKPDEVQPNLPNEKHGDFVAGEYTRTPCREDDDYNVPGFVPATGATGPIPNATSAPALLARMRRTNDFLGLDGQPGISSRGPTIPFLFARGTAIGKDPASTYSPREHGITVRALAIADARPAMSIGVPSATYGLLGAATFELTATFWSSNWDETTDPDNLTPSPENDETIAVQFHLSGIITRVGLLEQEGHGIVASSVMTVGDITAVNNEAPSGLPLEAYVPIVTTVEDTDGTMTKRIVAFGLLTIQDVDDLSTAEVELQLRRSISKVAAQNASAVIVTQASSSNIDWRKVLTAHKSVALPLLAAASAR
jgi:hypothetical protein